MKVNVCTKTALFLYHDIVILLSYKRKRFPSTPILNSAEIVAGII